MAGVLGSPISHSLSPLLHNTIYEMLKFDAKYSAYQVASGQLQGFLENEGSALSCISLTMPLKEEAITFADSVSELSQQIHSGNTLYKVEGRWNLTSTDVAGFTNALLSHGKKAEGSVLVIGAGATARAVVAACVGVSQTVTLISRNPDREIAVRKTARDLKIQFIPWETTVDFNKFDLIVNTTPGSAASIFIDQIDSVQSTFFELLYNPWPTALLAKWRSAGGYGIDGLDLLIHQAILQAEIFSTRELDRTLLEKSLRAVGEKALS